MKIAGGPETYFRVLEQEGIRDARPFREIGAMGIRLPGAAPLAVGTAAAVLAKKQMDRKKIRKIVRQEIDKERKSHPGPGLNGISFF